MGVVGLLAGRYLVSRRRERFIAVIGAIAVAGVALGVMALITTLAVMTGFDHDLQSKIVGANAHLTIQADGPIAEPERLIAQVAQLPNVTAAAPFVQGQGLFSAGARTTGAILRGIDPAREPSVTQLAAALDGGADAGPDGVILGRVLAQSLGVAPGDEVQVVTPASRTPKTLMVTGTFASGMYDYDANLALLRIATAQGLLGMTAGVTGIGVRVRDPLRAAGVQQEVRRRLGYPYWTVTWMDQNRNLFAALKLEKLVMFLILTLIVLVACFMIVATLLMMVVERIHDIGILKALGATGAQIRALFTVVGLAIGGTGTLLGLAGGVGLCEFLRRSQFVKLPPDIYYLDHLPVLLTASDVGVIVAAAVAISWLACLYPASVAARLSPVDALRYE
ncbi:MAG: hypothetical protein A3C53_05350 [Omnitrophica WOR_2 bacterium RIFCSPHIGHO2_02_FULL_68_15]|nr:MAG: hypothetical protein A3C53_05350 [Omnitrophica WOR_2 bacterium RIFCSPHIGHO2_02_FULL_68_15]